MTEAWLHAGDGGFELDVHVQPGARRTELAGVYGDALKIRLAAPPVDGKANECLLAFIAEFFEVPRREVVLVRGGTSRRKRIRVNGGSGERARTRVAALLAA